MSHQTDFPKTTIGNLLALLLALFALRVFAQCIQYLSPVTRLPSFTQWQSGAIPYPLLFAAQVAILAWGVLTIRGVRSGKLLPSQSKSKVYLVIGGIYLLTMLYRLLAGQTFASGHFWLDAILPTVFHIVLATFLLLLAVYHRQSITVAIQWTCYPLVMLLTLVFHGILIGHNVNLLVATYVPVLTAALVISILELKYPNRESWQATKNDWFNDIAFMAVIQGLLPRALGFLILIFLSGNSGINSITHYWPHHWSTLSQFLLMLLSADLLRYWLHRLSHNWTPLWRLHAVHHSPHKLYWTNVGRFHPLEKMIQYLFDALPFILLGVSPPVLALYFVFYATNGFFQHCNINLRLGFLNYLISGPELHRWHHSRLIEESNSNYGNNLIIWDIIFNSRYLPQQKTVKDLGLINRDYPLDFKSQMTTPFKGNLDKVG